MATITTTGGNALRMRRYQTATGLLRLTYVTCCQIVTHMEKTQIYLGKEELAALRAEARRSGRSIAELVRGAIREVVLKPQTGGPVGIWDGKPRRTSIEHDSVYDDI